MNTKSISAPKEQYEKWEQDIKEEGYSSKSAYYRQMIEAGRREMGLAETYPTEKDDEDNENDTPTVPNLEYRVRQQLDTETSKNASEIVDELVEDLERDVEDVLNTLMVDGSAQFRDNGFILSE